MFYNPVKIIFGRGAVAGIGKEAAAYGRKALLVYGRGSIKKNGVYAALAKSLRTAGVRFAEYGGVKPNPVISHVRQGIAAARRGGCGLVLAAGGGSALDEAKAIAAGVPYTGDAWDFFTGKAAVERALPLLCVPTLPASGSEMNSGFVITDEASRRKCAAYSDATFPAVSILDPETTAGLPPEQAAYGAADALSHLLEAYLSADSPDAAVTDELVEGLARAIIVSTRRIIRDRSDYNARASMMWAAALAANGLGVCGYGGMEFLNHAIEHSLSALYDIPHGAGMAVIMPACFRRRVKRTGPDRLARFGRNVLNVRGKTAKEAALLAVAAFERLLSGLGAPTRLSHLGIPAKDIPAIARNAAQAIAAAKITCPPSEVEAILRAAA